MVQKLLGLPTDTPNPHLWYDPKTMPAAAKAMAADLEQLQPAHAAYFESNLKTFLASLNPWYQAIAAFKKRIQERDGCDDRAGGGLLAHRHGHRQPDPVAVPGGHHERR